MGKHPGKQDICLLIETNSVSDKRLEASTTHAESPDTAEAWRLNSKQQCKDEETGRYVQFVGALNCDPIVIYRTPNTPEESDVSLIASQTEDQELTFLGDGKKKDSRMLWVGIISAMVTLTFLIAVLLRMRGG